MATTPTNRRRSTPAIRRTARTHGLRDARVVRKTSRVRAREPSNDAKRGAMDGRDRRLGPRRPVPGNWNIWIAPSVPNPLFRSGTSAQLRRDQASSNFPNYTSADRMSRISTRVFSRMGGECADLPFRRSGDALGLRPVYGRASRKCFKIGPYGAENGVLFSRSEIAAYTRARSTESPARVGCAA